MNLLTESGRCATSRDKSCCECKVCACLLLTTSSDSAMDKQLDRQTDRQRRTSERTEGRKERERDVF